MTNVYAPIGKVLTRIEVSDEEKNRVLLPDVFKGKTTLLFMATKAKHAELFESIYSLWRSTFGIEHKNYVACYVSLLKDSPTLDVATVEAARDAIRGITGRMITNTTTLTSTDMMPRVMMDGREDNNEEKMTEGMTRFKGNVLNTVCLTSLSRMNTWLSDMNIPTVFLDIYDDEYEEESDAARDTLDFPIVMLLSPDGVIKHCILGLEESKLYMQRNTLHELVTDAMPKATTAPPKNAPPVASKVDAVGIGTYEFFGLY